MEIMRGIIFILLSLITVEVFGQIEKDNFFIIDNQNNRLEVDSIRLNNNDYLTEIKTFRNGLEEIMTPFKIKGFEINGLGLSYVFESVFDLKNGKYDFTKKGIFLIRECSGKIELFTLVINGDMLFCAKNNNKWTLFNSNDFQKYIEFFMDKELVYSNVINLIQTNNWNHNSIIDIVNYYNNPPADFIGLEHYTNLDSLCFDLIKVIKSDNNKKIEKFCQKIFFNKYYNDYFKKYHFGYRGLPFSTDGELNSYISNNVRLMINIKDTWKQNCSLDSIKLISIDKQTVDILDFRYNIKFTGLQMKIKTDSEEKWGLGELLNVEGKWIVLFDPK
jgi:hypothetical protein